MIKGRKEKGRRASIEEVFKGLLEERYVHELSSLLYERIATLWHLDPEIERELAFICSRLWWGYFCIEYLSHFHRALMERYRIDKGLKAGEFTEGIKKDLRKKITDRDMARQLKEEILPQLREIMEKVEPRDMDRLTAMIHSGEYLLASLEDMAEDSYEEYPLWLSSIPHLYRKDLHYLGVIRPVARRPSMPLHNYIANLKDLMPRSEPAYPPPVRRRGGSRPLRKAVNLRKGFYPCKTRAFTLMV